MFSRPIIICVGLTVLAGMCADVYGMRRGTSGVSSSKKKKNEKGQEEYPTQAVEVIKPGPKETTGSSRNRDVRSSSSDVGVILVNKKKLEKLLRATFNLTPKVEISYAEFNDQDLERLVLGGVCPRVVSLDLRGARRIDNLKPLRYLSITELHLSQAGITDEGFQFLPETLVTLDLVSERKGKYYSERGVIPCSDVTNITDENIKVLIERCPNIEELYLGNQNALTHDGIKSLFKAYSNLRVLYLGNCVLFRGYEVACVSEHSRKLTELRMHIDNPCDCVLEIGRKDNLTKLDLSGVPIRVDSQDFPLKNLVLLKLQRSDISNDEMGWLFKRCPNLEELCVGYLNDSFSYETLQYLPQTLVRLTLRGKGIMGEVLKAVSERCPALQELHVSNLDNLLDDESIKYLPQSLIKLTIDGRRAINGEIITKDVLQSITKRCPNLIKLKFLRRSSWDNLKELMSYFPSSLKKPKPSQSEIDDAMDPSAIVFGQEGIKEIRESL